MFTALALAVLLQAAPPPSATAAKPMEKGSISGQVINALTGEPLKRAKVTLTRSGRPAADSAADANAVSTDESGRFEFPDVDPGEFVVAARRTGFAGEATTIRPGSETRAKVTLAPGAKVGDLRLRLTPQAVISGRVVDEEGEPARRVQVVALRPSYAQGRLTLERTGGEPATTDDLGEYRIHGLLPGGYYVQTRVTSASLSYAGVPNVPDRTYLDTYFPNSLDPASATRVDAQAGTEVVGINFKLRSSRGLKIRGRVVDDTTGQPSQIAGVAIWKADFSAPDGGTPSSLQARAKGEFEFTRLPPGAYVVLASQASKFARRTVELTTSNLENLELRLSSGEEIAGFVKVEGEQGSAGFSLAGSTIQLNSRDAVVLRKMSSSVSATVGALAALSQGSRSVLNLAVPSAGAYPDSGFNIQSLTLLLSLRASPAKVNADGDFAMQGVRPSLYDVSVTKLPDSFYLKSVRLDNQEAIETGLELTGNGRHRLDLVVSGDTAQVDGIVLDSQEKPAGQASVVLIPAMRSAQRLYRTTNPGQDGRFTLKGIPPGRYRLYAWEEVEEGAWFDPDFVGRHENDGESVSLDPRDRKTIGLKLLAAPQGQTR